MALSIERVRAMGSSRFNYWFGYVANITMVVWLTHRGLSGREALGWPERLACAASGLITWTFMEYVLHRYVYHEVPWYLTTAIVLLLHRGLCAVFAPAQTGLIMGFAWLGYVGYCLLHHGSHHWRFERSYLRAMKRHHQLHHAFPNSNWGFTTSLWDRVFGTYRSPKVRPLATSAHRGA